jgi:non-ribosomal peptide synthetase component E (peptide arylation enzyme)
MQWLLLMTGYWAKPEANAAAFTADGDVLKGSTL